MHSMAGLESFESELDERLELRRQELEETELPQLKGHFGRMQSSFQAIHNVLKKKGLLKEDPYKYEERLSGLDVPSDAPYLDSERDSELTQRLGKYETRLGYLVEYFDWSLTSLDLRTLKTVVKFVNFINWRSVSENSTQPTTRGLGEQMGKVKKGSDSLSANIVTDAQDQMSKASRQILSILKRVTAYQREQYKLEVRRSILTEPGIPDAPAETQYEAALSAVKSAFPRLLPGVPFARDLIVEIFAENNPDGGEAIRATLLDQLKPTEKTTARKKPEEELKPLLFDAARTLAGSSRSLEDAVRKLSDNVLVLESRKLSFAEMMRQIWERLRGKDATERRYTLEYVDSNTNARSSEELDFNQFVSTIGRRARVYNGLIAKSGPAWTKLQNSDEESLLRFVTKDAHELYELVRRLEALDTFLRAEIPREQRSQLRGINIETTAINDNLVRARKKTRQYVARIEEREQLRKLGITPQG